MPPCATTLVIPSAIGDNHHMDDQTEPAAANPAPSAPRLTMRLVAHDVAKGKDVKELLQAVAVRHPTTVPAGTE